MSSFFPHRLTRWVGVTSVAIIVAACSMSPRTPDYSNLPASAQPVGTPAPYGFDYMPSGSSAHYRVVSFQELPQWKQQNFSGSLAAFKNSCLKLANQPQWQYVCIRANQTANNHAAAQYFFEHYFNVWQVSQNGQLTGRVTGYYEPVLSGETQPSHLSRFPIYGVPHDFVSVPLPTRLRTGKGIVRITPTSANGGMIQENGAYIADLSQFPITARTSALKGRFVGNQFVPYFTRAQINAGALDNGRAPILGYANDPVELFFMHVQGSGRLRTSRGQFLRLGFADKNEYPYVSIGKYMSNRGYLPLAQTSMQNIKAWMQTNPTYLAEVLGQNPSYVFFRVLDGGSEQGPIGALGVPLTSGISGAVDKTFITLGAPFFLATTDPNNPNIGLNRLMVAQDAGSAIKGAVRVDYFWGYGEEAGKIAGKQNAMGYVWQLLPHGVMPTYRP